MRHVRNDMSGMQMPGMQMDGKKLRSCPRRMQARAPAWQPASVPAQ